MRWTKLANNYAVRTLLFTSTHPIRRNIEEKIKEEKEKLIDIEEEERSNQYSYLQPTSQLARLAKRIPDFQGELRFTTVEPWQKTTPKEKDKRSYTIIANLKKKQKEDLLQQWKVYYNTAKTGKGDQYLALRENPEVSFKLNSLPSSSRKLSSSYY